MPSDECISSMMGDNTPSPHIDKRSETTQKKAEIKLPHCPKKWLTSDYLDIDKYGILSIDNEIVLGVSAGLTKSQCDALAEKHNDALETAQKGKK